MRYTPFDQQRWTSGSIPSDYRFTDQRQEGAVDLYDYDARLYSPLLARFISPDSIVPDAGNVQDWNRYGYVRHNPMIHTDPSGHILFVPFLIKGAILLAKAAPVAVSAAAVVHKAAPTVQRAMVTAQRVASSAAHSGKAFAKDSAMDAVIGGGVDLAAQVTSGQPVDLRQTAGAAVGNIVASRTYAPVDKRFGTSFDDRLLKFIAATGSGAMGGVASDIVQGTNGENMVAGSLTQPAGSATGSFVERRTGNNLAGAVVGELTNRVLQDGLRTVPRLLHAPATQSSSSSGAGMRAQ
jgi:RHS repeat-associated protein